MTEIADAFTFIADEAAGGQRIDAFLAKVMPGISRAYIASLIHAGQVSVCQKKIKPGYRIRPGDEISGQIPAPRPGDCLPEQIPLDIIFQDKDLLVLNKPAGMVVHPAPGHPSGTLVNALLHHCPDLVGISGEIRPGIVHRLDKDTTGILVAAKNAEAQAGLAEQFKLRRIQKKYLAVVHGHMETSRGSIVMPIGRHPVDRIKMSTIAKSGRNAETRWVLLEPLPQASLVEVDLLTGRTHQIRVHFAAIRHAVVGDPLYGPRHGAFGSSEVFRTLLRSITRQMLHAWQIRFMHPTSGAEMCFTAPVPCDMDQFIIALRTVNPGA
ncbi:RluA family pseudouridine synthase [Desulfococcus sp.]|uniref:RluA family pseudouridine synthase n=1 Tax=Desulfococcus sp. TaxID=2025834 RepID=UPI0035934857